jgi:hypothetical protein
MQKRRVNSPTVCNVQQVLNIINGRFKTHLIYNSSAVRSLLNALRYTYVVGQYPLFKMTNSENVTHEITLNSHLLPYILVSILNNYRTCSALGVRQTIPKTHEIKQSFAKKLTAVKAFSKLFPFHKTLRDFTVFAKDHHWPLWC